MQLNQSIQQDRSPVWCGQCNRL